MKNKTTAGQVVYIDNLRVLMTVLVIFHHTLISYGAPGGWYFRDPTNNKVMISLMTILVATNQSFFMGFFFFLSALFIEPSYNKKGVGQFLIDRFKRLGIPLLFYSFVLGPFMNFLIYRYGRHKNVTFLEYLSGYDDWIDFGVLWFVAALLLFTIVYVLVRQTEKRVSKRRKGFPNDKRIFFFALVLGFVSYIVRIVFPIGWVLRPLGFQLAHFTQYVALYIVGILAFRNEWINRIPPSLGKKWLGISLVLVLIILPAAILLMQGNLQTVMGGGSWQSLLIAIWEQLTGIAIILTLSGLARYRWNKVTPLLKHMSRAGFATYIFHPLIVISLTLALLTWKVDPAVKLVVAAPCAIVLSFCLGWLITRLPLAKNIV